MGGILLTEDTNLGFANFQTQVQPSQLFYFPVQPKILKTPTKHAEIIYIFSGLWMFYPKNLQQVQGEVHQS